jgi:hypothetical protein
VIWLICAEKMIRKMMMTLLIQMMKNRIQIIIRALIALSKPLLLL